MRRTIGHDSCVSLHTMKGDMRGDRYNGDKLTYERDSRGEINEDKTRERDDSRWETEMTEMRDRIMTTYETIASMDET